MHYLQKKQPHIMKGVLQACYWMLLLLNLSTMHGVSNNFMDELFSLYIAKRIIAKRQQDASHRL